MSPLRRLCGALGQLVERVAGHRVDGWLVLLRVSLAHYEDIVCVSLERLHSKIIGARSGWIKTSSTGKTVPQPRKLYYHREGLSIGKGISRGEWLWTK